MLSTGHHRSLRALIACLDASYLTANDCFVSGAAPIVLSLGEYRPVDGLELTCFGLNGYKNIREAVSETSLGTVFQAPMALARTVRTDRFGIHTFVLDELKPIRFDIFKEHRFHQDPGERMGAFPVLSKNDLFVERLLANADRPLRARKISPAMVDLAMMVASWGSIPDAAWDKARRAYGSSVTEAYMAQGRMLRDAEIRSQCVQDLSLEPFADRTLIEILPRLLIDA